MLLIMQVFNYQVSLLNGRISLVDRRKVTRSANIKRRAHWKEHGKSSKFFTEILKCFKMHHIWNV